MQFAEALTLQAQQDLQRWEVQERATCEARLRTAEHQLYREAAQAHHQTEAASLRYFHHLRAEIQEAETSYRTSVQQEAEVFTQKWREEVQYHANSSAQAQSVLSAERQQHQRDLKEQAERWQASLDMVTEGAQEEILERNDTIEELTQYLEETAQEMEHYEEWCETYQQELAFTETNQLFQTSIEEMSPRQRLRLRNLFSLLLLSHLQFALGPLSLLSTYHLPLYLSNGPLLPILRGWRNNNKSKRLLKKRQPELLSNGKLTGMLSSEKPCPRYRGSKNLSKPVLVDRRQLYPPLRHILPATLQA